MAKFAAKTARPNVRGPVKTVAQDTTTYEGGTGYSRDAKSDLFLLAITNMVGEETFYESAEKRDTRFRDLVHQVTKEDPDWIRRFVPFLREKMFLRSAPVVMAAEYVKAGGKSGRSVVASALKRPDEPAELIAYWQREHGRNLPQPVKRGIADAAVRLYTERAALRYDGKERPIRMGDVIELMHPKPQAAWQHALFRYLLDARHHPDEIRASLEALPLVRKNRELWALPQDERRTLLEKDPAAIVEAGIDWEHLGAWVGKGGMTAGAWEAVIPGMGYMALLRNLRNFDQAGIAFDSPTAMAICRRIADQAEVKKSKQFPIRFLSAWKATSSLTYAAALERALELSVENIPFFKGRTLVLIDCSGSMEGTLSARSQVARREAAGVFGVALAKRCEAAEVVAYGNEHRYVSVARGASILRTVGQLVNMGGTETWQTLAATYDGHDRVVILTDEQAFAHTQRSWGRYDDTRTDAAKFRHVPVIYCFNLAGYERAMMESGEKGRYTIGGLSDACFTMLELIEQQKDGTWPF